MVYKMIQTTFLVLVSLWAVLGHFTLTYPDSRGYILEKESIGPCGGFNKTSRERVIYPLESSFVQINSLEKAYDYVTNIILENTTVMVGIGTNRYPGAACLPLKYKAKNATDAIVQVMYDSGNGTMYQCIDVTFQSTGPTMNTSACINADGSIGPGGKNNTYPDNRNSTGDESNTDPGNDNSTDHANDDSPQERNNSNNDDNKNSSASTLCVGSVIFVAFFVGLFI